MDGELKFGYLPAHVLLSINDLGNWKNRSLAIEKVHQGLVKLSDKSQLLEQLPEFVDFVIQLLQDHNFKVATAGLNILADLAATCGSLLQTHLSSLAPAIHHKLLDPREVVTAAAVKACSNLMTRCLPSSPIPLLSRLLQHNHQGDNRNASQLLDYSGMLEVLILAQLAYDVSKLDMHAAAEVLLSSLASRSPKQQALALESLALAIDALGPQLPDILRQAGAPEVAITEILQRTGKLQRPVLAADGSVRHGAEVLAAPASAGNGVLIDNLASFFIKAYGSNPGLGKGFTAADGSDASDLSLTKFAALRLQSDSSLGGSDSTAAAPTSPNSKLIWTAPVGGGSLGRPAAAARYDESQQQSWQQAQPQQDEQLLPADSLNALAAHAQLLHHASTMGGVAVDSSSAAANAARRTSSMPTRYDKFSSSAQQSTSSTADSIDSSSMSQLAPPAGSPLNSLRAAPGGWDVSGYGVRTSIGQRRRSSIEGADDLAASAAAPGGGISSLQNSLRGSLGSSSSIAAAAAAAGGAGSSSSLNNSFNSSIGNSMRSSAGASTGTVAAVQPRFDLPKSRFFGEDGSIEQQQVSRISSTSSQQYAPSFGSDTAVAPYTQLNSSLNNRYEQPQQQTRVPSDSTAAGQLNRSSGRDSGRGLGVLGFEAPAGVNSPEVATAAVPGQNQAGTDGSSSSWTTAGGSGWALAGSQPDGSPSTAGRAEALSPSRGERLAQLKRRQNEKRGSSASGGPRGEPGRDYSPSPDCSSPYALGQAGAAAFRGNSLPVGTAAYTDSSSAGGNWANNSGGSISAQRPCAGGGDDSSAAYSSNSNSSGWSNGYEASAAAAHPPSPLLKWNIQTVPQSSPTAGYQHVQQQQSDPQQQHVHGASSMHLRSAPAGLSPEAGMMEARNRPLATAATVAGYSGLGEPARRVNSDLSAAARLGAGPLSAATAEAPSYTPSSTRTAVSAAAVLTGSGAGGSDSSSSSDSQTIRQRRLGPGGALGIQQVTSASPEYPGAAKSSALTRKAAGSPAFGAAVGSPAQLRAQTAAAAVGMNAEWSGGGLNTGSPAPSTGSPGSKRGGVSDRPQSVGPDGEMGADLAPLPDPEASLRQAIAKLQQSNTAARKELDWQGQLEALLDARRLVAHHTEVLSTAAHELVLAALPAVEELRSTTARMAMLLFQELPAVLGRSLERELDDIVPVLLKKAGELSTAGRDNFLASEADKSLSILLAAVSETRALATLIASGMQHKSPHVRTRAAAHLDEVAAGGAGLEGLVRGNWPLLERVFKAAAAFLQEGSLDTRTYGKRLLWAVKSAVRSNRADMDRLLAAVTPEAVQRRVVEVVDGLSAAPPPPPTRAGGIGAASRGSSRGPGTPTPGQLNTGSAVSSPVTPSSNYGAASATAAGTTPPGSASRPGNGSATASSRVRRQLVPSNSNNSSNGDGSGGKLHSQGAAGAGDGAALNSPVKRTPSRNRNTSDSTTNSGLGSNSSAIPSTPAGPPGPMSPELQEAVDQVGQHLASKDWRNRSDALCALSALLPALPEVPNGPLEELLNNLVARLSDGNAKVNVQAMQVLSEVLGTIEARILLVMPSLAPALASNLGSANAQVRTTAAAAMDSLVSVVPPGSLLQSLSHIVMHSSNVRSKVVLVEKLTGLAPQVYRYQPQVVVKQVLPTAFTLAQEARGELKQPASQLLTVLAQLMGAPALLGHAANVSTAVETKVRDLLPVGWA